MSSAPDGTSLVSDTDFDVVIVGYGPVGQALAALLGRAGHRVAAFERFNEIYRLPRAVHLDHEIMRLLQSLGLGDVLAAEMVPIPNKVGDVVRIEIEGIATLENTVIEEPDGYLAPEVHEEFAWAH